MREMLKSVLAAGVLMLAAAAPAAAQAMISSPVRFGLTGGATLPIGNLKDVSGTGWNAGALIDVGLPLVPVGFRVDALWNQFGTKTFSDGSSEKNRVIDGTANVVYTFGSMLPTKFYLIGGVGLYNIKSEFTAPATATVSNTQTKFGVNAGAGLRFQLPGFSTFVEARWHDIFTSGGSTQMVPVNIGITF